MQCEVIAQGALTNSKRAESFVKGVYPTALKEGSGAIVWDIHGKRYIDFICALGSNLLGYGNEEIIGVCVERLRKGVTFSLGTTLEIELCHKLKEFFPWTEQFKFLKTGSEACTAAVRIARAKFHGVIGKSLVYSEGYHGFHDEFVSLSSPAAGVTKHEYIRPLVFPNHPDLTHAAAVIVEPVITDYSEPRRQWLEWLRKECDRTGCVLIFDEVITGFRFQKHSVSKFFAIHPDLICLGKGIANGLPLAVVGGSRELMDNPLYFVSSTFAGDTLSIAAALKTMELLQSKLQIKTLWDVGHRFQMSFNAIAPESIRIEGYPTRGVFVGDEHFRALFFQECSKAGVLFGMSWFFSFPHIHLVDQVLAICRDVVIKIKTGSVRLEGEMPKTPFAQKMRG